MRSPISLFCAITLASLAPAAAFASGPDADAGEMAVLPNGVFRPLYRAAGSPEVTPVKSFALDVLPVTNEDFLKFVTAHPEWRRSRASRAAADESYLKDWAEDLRPGDKAPLDAPVTYVSLDAATACAQWRGKRLPTLAEWEYAASASPTRADGQNDAAFKREVLRWYSTPAPAILPPAGSGATNVWGVRDLHGLVWEWVSDFAAAGPAVESQAKGNAGKDRFCGAGSVGARNAQDFPAFMRYGFRGSLKANYCIHNLGFRCAKDLPFTTARREPATFSLP